MCINIHSAFEIQRQCGRGKGGFSVGGKKAESASVDWRAEAVTSRDRFQGDGEGRIKALMKMLPARVMCAIEMGDN